LARGFLELVRTRHRWRTFELDAAGRSARQALAAFEEASGQHAENSGGSVSPAVQWHLTLAQQTIAATDAYGALLRGEMAVAEEAISAATGHLRWLTRSSRPARHRTLERLAALDERRAQLEAITDLARGRSHSLFGYIATASLPLQGTLGTQVARDLEELGAAFSVRAWRLSIIGAGALLEGLTLHALKEHYTAQQAAPAVLDQLQKMALADLLERAANQRLISQGSRLIGDALREHRNLVHPGKEERSRYRIDQTTASAALDVLLCVIKDLYP
jgi:hypothetical protein